MNLTLHLAAWDLRYLRHYWVLWLGLVILQAGLVGYAPQLSPVERAHVFSLSFFAWLVAVLKVCLLAVIVARLVQKDSTIGSTAFWLSRPVSRTRLLAAKVLFLVLSIILPSLLVEVGLLFACEVAPADILRSLPQILFLTVLALAPLMMVSAVTTSLAGMILAGGLTLLGLPLVWFFFLGAGLFLLLVTGTGTLPEAGVSVVRPIPPLSLGTNLMGNTLAPLVTAGVVVGFQYLTRRTTWSRMLLVAGVCCALLSTEYLRWGLWTDSPGPDNAIPDPAAVGARVERESLAFDPTAAAWRFSGLEGEKKMLLKGNIVPAPLPPDVAALPVQISARLLSPSGESLADHVSLSNNAYDFFERDDGLAFGSDRAAVLRQALKGVTFLNDEVPVGLRNSELFALDKSIYDRHRREGLIYSAQVDFLVQRDAIAVMRLEEGSVYNMGSDRVAILSIDTSKPGRLVVHLNEFGHRLLQDGRKQSSYLLINRSRRQALVGRAWSDSLSMPPMMSSVLPMLKVSRLRLDFDPLGDDPSIDPHWMEGAEFIRVQSRDLGWFSKSVRLENLVMDRIPRSSPEASPSGEDG